jgi:hypothetical protein
MLGRAKISGEWSFLGGIMEGFRSIFLFATLFALTGFAQTPVKNSLQYKVVTELSRNEPYFEPHLFHDNLLWVGRSRDAKTDNTQYQIEVYDSAGNPAAAPLAIPHTASFLYAFGAGSAIVVGKTANPYWQTHYTVVRYANGNLSGDTVDFPSEIQADTFGGDENNLYFTEPGDGAVFHYQPGFSSLDPVHFLSPTLHGPRGLQLVGKDLFVMISNGGNNEYNLLKLDTSTQATDFTFKSGFRNLLTTMVKVPDRPLLALTERGADKLLLVDTDTNQLTQELPAKGEPWGLASYGKHCLAVMAQTDLTVHFYDLNANQALADWDVSAVINRFHRPRALAADPATGTLYIRSNDICPTCQVSFNKIFRVEEKDGSTFKACE